VPEPTKSELLEYIDKLFKERLDFVQAFTERTYNSAYNSLRIALVLGGGLIAILSFFGLKNVWEIDSKVDSKVSEGVTRYFQSHAIDKRVKEAEVQANAIRLSDDLEQKSILLEWKLRQGGREETKERDVSLFITSNLSDIIQVLSLGDERSLRLLTLLNRGLDVENGGNGPLLGSANNEAGGKEWPGLEEVVEKLRHESKNTRLVEEAYRLELSYLDENAAPDLLDLLDKILSARTFLDRFRDTRVPSYISERADTYLLLLARNARSHQVTYRERLKSLCSLAIEKDEMDWKLAGTIATSWIDGADQSALDAKLIALTASDTSRAAFLNFLSTHATILFPVGPFRLLAYPSETLMSKMFRDLEGETKPLRSLSTQEAKIQLRRKNQELYSFRGLAEARSFYQRLAEQTLSDTKTNEEAVDAIRLLFPDGPFEFQEVRDVPQLAITTHSNPNFQVVPSSWDVIQCRTGGANRKTQARAPVSGAEPSVRITLESCEKVDRADIDRWRVYFKRNPDYEERH
jgi:hypothetical protein